MKVSETQKVLFTCTMKLVAAVLSVLHPYVTVLLLLPLIGWAVQAAALPAIHELSPPLANPTTYKIVGEVSKKVSDLYF